MVSAAMMATPAHVLCLEHDLLICPLDTDAPPDLLELSFGVSEHSRMAARWLTRIRTAFLGPFNLYLA